MTPNAPIDKPLSDYFDPDLLELILKEKFLLPKEILDHQIKTTHELAELTDQPVEKTHAELERLSNLATGVKINRQQLPGREVMVVEHDPSDLDNGRLETINFEKFDPSRALEEGNLKSKTLIFYSHNPQRALSSAMFMRERGVQAFCLIKSNLRIF